MRFTTEYEIEVHSPDGWNDVFCIGTEYESAEMYGFTTGPNSIGPVRGETVGQIVDKLIEEISGRVLSGGLK